MRIRPFDFHAARSLDEVFNRLDQAGSDGWLLAGGTDMVLNMKKKRTCPSSLISLHLLKDLESIEEKDGVIHIGTLAKHADLAVHPILVKTVPILCQAVGLIGSWQVRNIGTIGGNICNASPAADSAPPLLALEAELVTLSGQGEKIIPISSFFTGPGQTVMQPNEILKEIRIKNPGRSSAGCYLKLRRRKAVDISIAGVAFQAQSNVSGQNLKKVRIALGGVAPTPIRVPEAEACLEGLSLKEALNEIPRCAEITAAAAKPIDDIRGSAGYKRTIINVFTQRSARQVLTRLYAGFNNG